MIYPYSRVRVTNRIIFIVSVYSNGQLSAVCNALGLNGWGTKAMLMKRLQQSVERIMRDDELIRREGLAHLTVDEL